MRHARILCLIAVLLTVSACERRSNHDEALNTGRDSTVLNERESRLEKSLAVADSGQGEDRPIARWLLPPELSEISGLALTDDGRLFAHNDESARISEIDYRRGTILKHFYAGEKDLRGDFEGLIDRQRTFRQPLCKRLALEVLDDDVIGVSHQEVGGPHAGNLRQGLAQPLV